MEHLGSACPTCATAERIVRNEVHHVASTMVAEMLQGPYGVDCDYGLASQTVYVPVHDETHEEGPEFATEEDAKDWPERAEFWTIEERTHEALEHWIITDWLGDKLRAKGEIVGELFEFTIWGRCTSGQGIACDSVILDVARELAR